MMKFKYIVFAIIIGFLAVNAAGAGFLDDLTDTSENVTVDGIKFHIPDPYEEYEDESLVNESFEFEGNTFDVDVHYYANYDDNTVIGVGVIDTGINLTLDDWKGDDNKSTVKTINGHEGVLHEADEDGMVEFDYIEGEKIAVIIVYDETLLEEVIIK